MAEQTVTVGVGALSIEDVIAVARGGAKVAISDESKHEMALSRAVIDHLADDTVPHYGISTGFGALASTSIPNGTACAAAEKSDSLACRRCRTGSGA